jgi:hypothetical protein
MESGLWFVIDVAIEAERFGIPVESLTSSSLAIRARLSRLPKHMKRSVDEYRVGLGMAPLWGFVPSYPPDEYGAVARRRRLNRDSQRRCRERKRKAKDGTPNG